MRQIRPVEQELLELLGTADFEQAAAFRDQVASIESVESNCGCGCPSFTPQVDRSGVAPVIVWNSMYPYVLMEHGRPDGLDRQVLASFDQDGYLSNVECVFADEAVDEWPEPERCAVERSMLA